jgi:hypothetical protein
MMSIHGTTPEVHRAGGPGTIWPTRIGGAEKGGAGGTGAADIGLRRSTSIAYAEAA